MKVRTLLAVVAAASLLVGCSKADLRELGRETEEALRDAGDALDELAGKAEGPIRDAAEHALDAADEARDASRAFADHPTAETRQALETAADHVEDAKRELTGLVYRAPEPVKDLVQRVIETLTDVGRRIERQLDES